MKRKFKIRYNDDTAGYNASVKEETITLKRSKNSSWTKPGEKVLRLLDTGNGFKISGDINLSLDYSIAAELLHVLQLKEIVDKQWHGSVKYTESSSSDE